VSACGGCDTALEMDAPFPKAPPKPAQSNTVAAQARVCKSALSWIRFGA
jgi:hypothetical protein